MADTVVVTGTSGYIATEIVKQLLEKGFRVRGTVLSKTDLDDVGHLFKLNQAFPGSLTLHEANLLDDGAFDFICAGAKYVIHTASINNPIPIPTDPEAQQRLVNTNVEGTKNVMSSILRCKDTVKRVVLTSSDAAIKSYKRPQDPKDEDGLYSEHDWNEASVQEEEPYSISKVKAEHAAWEIATAEGIDLVVVNPSQVMGPVTFARSNSTSIQYMKGWLEGTISPDEISLSIVDVRDVANAHIMAATIPEAFGRYLISLSETINGGMLYKILCERFPNASFQHGTHEEPRKLANNSKAQNDLGVTFRPVKETIVDMAVTMLQLGLAKLKEVEQLGQLASEG